MRLERIIAPSSALSSTEHPAERESERLIITGTDDTTKRERRGTKRAPASPKTEHDDTVDEEDKAATTSGGHLLDITA